MHILSGPVQRRESNQRTLRQRKWSKVTSTEFALTDSGHRH